MIFIVGGYLVKVQNSDKLNNAPIVFKLSLMFQITKVNFL